MKIKPMHFIPFYGGYKFFKEYFGLQKVSMRNGYTLTIGVVDKPPLTWVLKEIDRLETGVKRMNDKIISLGKLYKQK